MDWCRTEREQHDRSYPIVKRMNTLLRHEPLPRGEDGAIEFRRLKLQFVSRFPNSAIWPIRSSINHLERGGGHKKRFQYCTDSTGAEILYLRAIQGHSRENPVDPSLQDNVLIPNDFFEHIHHVGSNLNQHPIIDAGLIAGRRNSSRRRQTVLFTAVDPVEVHLHEQKEFDLTKPRLASYKQKWKVHSDAMYWVIFRLAQRKGLPFFFQTRSNAIILHDTLPSFCIKRVVSTKIQEVSHTKTYRSPRPAPTDTLKDNWQKDWKHDAAASSSSFKSIQLKRKDRVAGTGEPVTVGDRVRFDQESKSKHVEKRQCEMWSS